LMAAIVNRSGGPIQVYIAPDEQIEVAPGEQIELPESAVCPRVELAPSRVEFSSGAWAAPCAASASAHRTDVNECPR
jgi:hypothetical protein